MVTTCPSPPMPVTEPRRLRLPFLVLLTALHQRWTLVLEGMSDADFARTINHPEAGTLRLDQLLAMYAWHGRHHTAHVAGLKERQKW